jgi:hypothetical protein
MSGSSIVFLVIIIVIFLIWLEWVIGKAIGKHISKQFGLVLGIVFIVCGISLIVGIACIVYSQANKDVLTYDINVNANVNPDLIRNITPHYENGHYNNVISARPAGLIESDTRECPFCAETMKIPRRRALNLTHKIKQFAVVKQGI